MSRTILILLAIAALVLLVLLATGVINFNTKGELRAPDVNINAQGGSFPDVDVDTNSAALNELTQDVGNGVDRAGDAARNVNVPDVDVDVNTNRQ